MNKAIKEGMVVYTQENVEMNWNCNTILLKWEYLMWFASISFIKMGLHFH